MKNKETSNAAILLDVIRTRRSIRKYTGAKVPDNIVNNILEAGRWAPSAHNWQPWKFVVITNKDLIISVRDIMLKKSKNMLAGFNIVMKETANCLSTAPLLIAVYSDGNITKKFVKYGKPYIDVGSMYDTQSISMAMCNMMLYATAEGIGSACLGMVLFCEKEINGFLHQSNKLLALLSFGFPSEPGQSVKRKNISEMVTFQ